MKHDEIDKMLITGNAPRLHRSNLNLTNVNTALDFLLLYFPVSVIIDSLSNQKPIAGDNWVSLSFFCNKLGITKEMIDTKVRSAITLNDQYEVDKIKQKSWWKLWQ